jgi:hypothetical protein
MIASAAVAEGHHAENLGYGNRDAFEGKALPRIEIPAVKNVFERGSRNAF